MSKTKTKSKTKRKFRAHENLVYLTFKRQAGSIGKAALEGIMNCIDAGSSEIQVSFSDKKLVIKDDGKGMNTIEEINDYFDCVGAPHEMDEHGISTDARFGTFRLGRGQMFCFGVNRWRTGPFEMIIDMKENGLDYEMTEHPDDPVKGCIVEIDLYEPLERWSYDNAIEEIKRYVQYVDIPVTLNGVQINTDPKDMKWDFEDELFYLKVDTERTTGGIDVYQQGVYVRNLAAYQWGVSGTLVSKGPMVLNVARNDIMQNECPVWKKASTLLKKQFTEQTVKKKALDPSEREAMMAKLRTKSISAGAIDDYNSCQIFRDVNGKCWSWNMIKLVPNRFQKLPNGKVAICFAQAYQSKPCRMVDQKLALVLDRQILTSCKCTEEEFLTKILNQFDTSWRCRQIEKFEITDIDKLNTKMDEAARLYDSKDITKKEDRILRALADANEYIAHSVYRDEIESRRSESSTDWAAFSRFKDSFVRRLVIGEHEGAQAFTNGSDYVAFCRDFVRRTGSTLPGFVKLVSVLLHEYCHDAPDTETHNHTPAFYETFEHSHHSVGDWAWYAFKSYCQIMQREVKKIPQKESANLHDAVRASHYDDFLEEYLEDDSTRATKSN